MTRPLFWGGRAARAASCACFSLCDVSCHEKAQARQKILMAGASVCAERSNLTESEFLLVESSVFLPGVGPVQLSTFSEVITTALTSLGRPFNTMKPLLVCKYNYW